MNINFEYEFFKYDNYYSTYRFFLDSAIENSVDYIILEQMWYNFGMIDQFSEIDVFLDIDPCSTIRAFVSDSINKKF